MIRTVGAVIAFLLLVRGETRAEDRVPLPSVRQLATMVQPFRVDLAKLSPDGRRVAFTERDGRMLQIVILDLQQLSRVIIPVGEINSLALVQFRVPVEARVSAMIWAGPTRLVYQATVPAKEEDIGRRRVEVRAVDADGSHNVLLADPTEVSELYSPEPPMPSARSLDAGESPEPPEMPPPVLIPRIPRLIGVSSEQPGIVYLEATGGMNAVSELFHADSFTGKLKSISVETERGRVVYDQQGQRRLLETATFRMEKPMLRIDFMFPPQPWATPRRFRYMPPGTSRWVDLDSYLFGAEKPEWEETAENFYRQRSFPLGFDRDARVLYFASNVGRDTFAIYALDLVQRKRTELCVADPVRDIVDPGQSCRDEMLVRDRRGNVVGIRCGAAEGPLSLVASEARVRWFDERLRGLQVASEALFGRRSVRVLDWDDTLTKVLLLAARPGEPGRYFVVEPKNAAQPIVEVAARAPWLASDAMPEMREFEFADGGRRLTGTLTIAPRSRATPPPAVIVCGDLPGARRKAEFDRLGQLLAVMGYAVVRVDVRGGSGRGSEFRDAIRSDLDRPVEDIRATASWLIAQKWINPRYVSTLGFGLGGWVAVRAAEQFPREFRCAITIGGVSDVASWVSEPAVQESRGIDFDVTVRNAFFAGLKPNAASYNLAKQSATFTRPVLIVQNPRKGPFAERQSTELRDAMKRHGVAMEYMSATFDPADPTGFARAAGRIVGFLNDRVFSYRVDVGETKEVE